MQVVKITGSLEVGVISGRSLSDLSEFVQSGLTLNGKDSHYRRYILCKLFGKRPKV